MSERLKEPASKAGSLAKPGSWVRIPPSPPFRLGRNALPALSLSKGASEALMIESKGWSCYILECGDRSYYVGVATDLREREEEHNSGHGAKHTRLRRPVRLVWSRECSSYAQARALEARLKGWSREKKKRLIAGSLRLDQRLAQTE